MKEITTRGDICLNDEYNFTYSGMGALAYRPSNEMNAEMTGMTLDELAEECEKMFDTEHSEHLDELFRLGGSSGGARPKVNYEIRGGEIE